MFNRSTTPQKDMKQNTAGRACNAGDAETLGTARGLITNRETVDLAIYASDSTPIPAPALNTLNLRQWKV